MPLTSVLQFFFGERQSGAPAQPVLCFQVCATLIFHQPSPGGGGESRDDLAHGVSNLRGEHAHGVIVSATDCRDRCRDRGL